MEHIRPNAGDIKILDPMETYICRAVISGVKMSFPVKAHSFKEALAESYDFVVGLWHGEVLTVKKEKVPAATAIATSTYVIIYTDIITDYGRKVKTFFKILRKNGGNTE